MKKKEKRGLLILIGAAILIIATIWFVTRPKEEVKNDNKGGSQNSSTSTAQGEYTKVESDGTIVNTSEKLNEDKEQSGFAITDINFEEKDGRTVLTATVTNKTGSTQESFLGEIVLLDKAGKEIGRIPVRISETQNGEAIDVRATITERYANAYNFKLEK